MYTAGSSLRRDGREEGEGNAEGGRRKDVPPYRRMVTPTQLLHAGCKNAKFEGKKMRFSSGETLWNRGSGGKKMANSPGFFAEIARRKPLLQSSTPQVPFQRGPRRRRKCMYSSTLRRRTPVVARERGGRVLCHNFARQTKQAADNHCQRLARRAGDGIWLLSWRGTAYSCSIADCGIPWPGLFA